MNKRWEIKPSGDASTVANLAQALGIELPLANLLVQRGITSFDEARDFFRPDLEKLHDPFLMQDMDAAVQRLTRAIENNENILIYGDYDVDGTTSVAMMYAFLRERYANLEYYIPDRYSEGYGISFEGIDYAHRKNFSLVIALDCGIKANDKIDAAKKNGIDFIICDHHKPSDEIPAAAAVLDPKRPDCKYPFKELSGCGVGFKLLQAYSLRNAIPFSKLAAYLDLVCVSIASDIVPITGENRILSYHGLKLLNENPRPGLNAIMTVSTVDDKESLMLGTNNLKRMSQRRKPFTISDVVFKIGPRINAAGRIERGGKAVKLLVENDVEEAFLMSQRINDYNLTRKSLDANITEEALELIKSDEVQRNKKTTVLFKPDWHKGVIGIVASRLTEIYYRPTVVLTESQGKATGSARSVEGFNLYNAIEMCSDLLDGFGGHTYAAGLTMKKENVPAFIERFEQAVSNSISEAQQIPRIEIDTQLSFNDITPKFYRILKQFAPFGPDNMSPIFMSEPVLDTGTSKLVGANREHLKLTLIHQGKIMPAIAFNQSQHYYNIKQRKPFKICYSIEENEYKGEITLQLVIKDIRFL